MNEKKHKEPSLFKYGRILEKGKPVHSKYDPFSIRHPPMELSRRAKIFHPFDALKGFHEAITAKEILCEKRRELSEAEAEKLDRILVRLKELTKNGKTTRKNHVLATITCFVPFKAPNHPGSDTYGTCKKISGTVFGIDEICRTIKMDDIEIPFDDILDIDCEMEDIHDSFS